MSGRQETAPPCSCPQCSPGLIHRLLCDRHFCVDCCRGCERKEEPLNPRASYRDNPRLAPVAESPGLLRRTAWAIWRFLLVVLTGALTEHFLGRADRPERWR